jgi:hypothetical protein
MISLFQAKRKRGISMTCVSKKRLVFPRAFALELLSVMLKSFGTNTNVE